MSFPKAPRGWKAAIDTAESYARNGRRTETGMCLRETRRYYGVPSRFPAAKDSLQDALNEGKAYRIRNWSKVPRGAIVYWRGGGSQYGHVAISVGGGNVISTDVPSSGRYGRIHGGTLMRSWGYTEAYWSPLVNGYRVWPRHDLYRPKSKPKPVKKWGPVNVRRVNAALRGGPIDRGTKKQMNRIVWALRAQLGPNAAKGYRKHPRASLRRALKKFRKGETHGLMSKGAGSRLRHLKNVVNRKWK